MSDLINHTGSRSRPLCRCRSGHHDLPVIVMVIIIVVLAIVMIGTFMIASSRSPSPFQVSRASEGGAGNVRLGCTAGGAKP